MPQLTARDSAVIQARALEQISSTDMSDFLYDFGRTNRSVNLPNG